MLGTSCWHPCVFARSPRMGHPPLLSLHHPQRCPSPSPHSRPHSRCAGAGQPHKKPPCSVNVHPFPEPVSPTTCAPTSPSLHLTPLPPRPAQLPPSYPPSPRVYVPFLAPTSRHNLVPLGPAMSPPSPLRHHRQRAALPRQIPSPHLLG